MEDGYIFSRQSNIGEWRSLRDGDFEEEDVWVVLKENKDSSFKVGHQFIESSITVRKHLPSAARMIPSGTHEANDVKQQSSAPVNIPDWSKLSTKMRNGSWHDDDDDGWHGYGDVCNDDDGYKSKLPPHEILARRLARSQISSFSVFEGVGRKLKGRDLRKVRNAVLTRTGFLE